MKTWKGTKSNFPRGSTELVLWLHAEGSNSDLTLWAWKEERHIGWQILLEKSAILKISRFIWRTVVGDSPEKREHHGEHRRGPMNRHVWTKTSEWKMNSRENLADRTVHSWSSSCSTPSRRTGKIQNIGFLSWTSLQQAIHRNAVLNSLRVGGASCIRFNKIQPDRSDPGCSRFPSSFSRDIATNSLRGEFNILREIEIYTPRKFVERSEATCGN